MNPENADITALVLAGGRGSRMGGVDKGLTELGGKALVSHSLERLAPQVGTILINANRSAEQYAAFGWPVIPDNNPDEFAGPLAGMLAGLEHCTTQWLLTAPCDSPWIPPDYASRMLTAATDAKARIAMASDGQRHQPVFCLINRECVDSLRQFLDAGDRKIDLWTRREGAAEAVFSDPSAFININTPNDLRRNDTR